MKIKSDAPPVGYYRKLLPGKFAGFRMARTDTGQPMIGVRPLPASFNAEVAAYFDTLSDPLAAAYAERLRSGACIMIETVAGPEKIWAPGELFLRS